MVSIAWCAFFIRKALCTGVFVVWSLLKNKPDKFFNSTTYAKQHARAKHEPAAVNPILSALFTRTGSLTNARDARTQRWTQLEAAGRANLPQRHARRRERHRLCRLVQAGEGPQPLVRRCPLAPHPFRCAHPRLFLAVGGASADAATFAVEGRLPPPPPDGRPRGLRIHSLAIPDGIPRRS